MPLKLGLSGSIRNPHINSPDSEAARGVGWIEGQGTNIKASNPIREFPWAGRQGTLHILCRGSQGFRDWTLEVVSDRLTLACSLSYILIHQCFHEISKRHICVERQWGCPHLPLRANTSPNTHQWRKGCSLILIKCNHMAHRNSGPWVHNTLWPWTLSWLPSQPRQRGFQGARQFQR